MEGGLIYVLCEPSDQVKPEEFHDWFANEHVPKRMDNNLPEFLTCTLFHSLGSDPPAQWLIVYEISSVSFFEDPRLLSVLTSASQRERELMKKYTIVDIRRGGQKLQDTGSVRETKGAPPFLVSVGLTPGGGEEDLEKWYREEHLSMISKIPHFRRGMRFKVTDSKLHQSGKEDEVGKAPQFLALYEYDQLGPEVVESEQWKAVLETPWAKKHMANMKQSEVAMWKLYKDWENTAHKK
ncbi:hypothetical protein BT69DRAFT_1355601 [Atractiella rhizophila]|nr:hypothetical protein BT69DRAFT_1355601 [Atractiella rhizophila]